MSRSFTRKFSSPAPQLFRWLVLVGNDAHLEYELWMCIPCEDTARRELNIPPHVPILIGQP
jgi:hypothetical protein